MQHILPYVLPRWDYLSAEEEHELHDYSDALLTSAIQKAKKTNTPYGLYIGETSIIMMPLTEATKMKLVGQALPTGGGNIDDLREPFTRFVIFKKIF